MCALSHAVLPILEILGASQRRFRGGILIWLWGSRHLSQTGTNDIDPHLRPVATGRLRKGSSPVDSSIMSASYQPLREEAAAPVYSSKGHTSAEAAAEQLKWGKNEIPEEKESVREAAFCL